MVHSHTRNNSHTRTHSHLDEHTHAGLEKAMEAKKRERALTKFLEANGLQDQVNIDLTYSCDFNLAVCFHANKDYQEALDHFSGESGAVREGKRRREMGRREVRRDGWRCGAQEPDSLTSPQ
jgi:hypothetical protein